MVSILLFPFPRHVQEVVHVMEIFNHEGKGNEENQKKEKYGDTQLALTLIPVAAKKNQRNKSIEIPV